DERPIRLVYGNRVMAQMVCQDEIEAMKLSLPDFEQVLVLEDPPEASDALRGVIDRDALERTFRSTGRNEWLYYVCGSRGMVDSVVRSLSLLGIPAKQIHYERLSF
ncbi:MAG: ferredoxin reductase family protein, partial [Gammaproteobacteria bacterium]